MAFGLKISEAASLALHTMVLLETNREKLFSTPEIASRLNASKDHLSKVLQRLVRSGLVKSIRGQKGGFKLARPGSEITLLEVYEAIDGPFGENYCLAESPICSGKSCIFRNHLKKLTRELKKYMAETHLSELTDIYRRKKICHSGK